MHPALPADALEPLQLGKGIGMIIDAQIERGPFFTLVDQQRRRLLSALVAAGGLARAHRRDQALGERQRRVSVIGLRGLFQHLRAGSMLPAMEEPSPATWPHQSTQSLPV